jgi:hypothetical protein
MDWRGLGVLRTRRLGMRLLLDSMRVLLLSRYVHFRPVTGGEMADKQLGRDEPSVSMDSAGKIVYAKNTEILTANVSNLGADGTPLGSPRDRS